MSRPATSLRGPLLLAAASVAAYALVWAYAALTLPARVPIHFGPSGDADRFAARTEALAFFAGVGALLALVFWLADRATARESLTWLNIPHKEWWTATPERRERARALLRHDGLVLAAATGVLMVVVLASTVAAAAADEPRLGWVFFAAFGAYVVGIALWVVRMYRGSYHPDHQEDL